MSDAAPFSQKYQIIVCPRCNGSGVEDRRSVYDGVTTVRRCQTCGGARVVEERTVVTISKVEKVKAGDDWR
ncbi:hypothetical protein TRP8649_03282 [Pelagimonas phthalicica]|uniref:Uncharacterized protein n=1 Tax=Pelagimonas phthalicica TaxID=1037362 RepID=A0A238JEU3_9RHOB|nr:hypothetical protein [Pelagimonas phthalicica]SMX29149.1 hypothetical protein TRP8649_03282 [Pelagimonas phthalicica]